MTDRRFGASAQGLKKTTEIQAALARAHERPRRDHALRARTIRVARVSKRETRLARERLLASEETVERPRTRGECENGPRPCPHVTCKHHLYLDVSPRTGTIRLNFPDLEVWEMAVSCALDIADGGGVRLEDIGALMNITRERARQIEVRALVKLEALSDLKALQDLDE